MASFGEKGTLYKAKEVVKVFARRRPSLRTLWANRRQRFEQAHAILPSDAVAGEPVRLLVQAWDQCERLVDGFDGRFAVESTDGAASLPDRVEFPPESGGVTVQRGITFHTPGIQYLTLRHERTGERFVSNPVRVSAEPPAERLYYVRLRQADGGMAWAGPIWVAVDSAA